jgi:hypothetical protein
MKNDPTIEEAFNAYIITGLGNPRLGLANELERNLSCSDELQ